MATVPNGECALDDLDVVDPNLRLGACTPGGKVRVAVIVEVHRDRDPEEAANRRHPADIAAPPVVSTLKEGSAAAGRAGLPPVGLLLTLLAPPLKRQRGVFPSRSARPAEAP